LDRHKKEKYRECPLYITGESYCGKYIPNMATEIMDQNNDKDNELPDINLKGLAIGDGWINPELQTKTSRLKPSWIMPFKWDSWILSRNRRS
jgi:carboxypeptidase C (cathepsin A)